jgi:hypothetical protein
MRFASERSLNAIKLRKISPLLDKEGPEVVKKVNSIQIVNYHPPTPSLVRRERIWLNLMAVERSLESSDDVFRLRLYPSYAGCFNNCRRNQHKAPCIYFLKESFGRLGKFFIEYATENRCISVNSHVLRFIFGWFIMQAKVGWVYKPR